jgi:hypothetical protein
VAGKVADGLGRGLASGVSASGSAGREVVSGQRRLAGRNFRLLAILTHCVLGGNGTGSLDNVQDEESPGLPQFLQHTDARSR